jgi:hypothetical protein
MKAVREHRGTERVISKFEDSERPDITFLPWTASWAITSAFQSSLDYTADFIRVPWNFLAKFYTSQLQVDTIGFWRWCVTHRNIVFFNFLILFFNVNFSVSSHGLNLVSGVYSLSVLWHGLSSDWG